MPLTFQLKIQIDRGWWRGFVVCESTWCVSESGSGRNFLRIGGGLMERHERLALSLARFNGFTGVDIV